MKVKVGLKYFRRNWGAPFIIAFQALLVMAAIYLSSGLQDAANEIAIYAYYALVVGVILQIASYIKYRDESD